MVGDWNKHEVYMAGEVAVMHIFEEFGSWGFRALLFNEIWGNVAEG